jgi:hypothetical protein
MYVFRKLQELNSDEQAAKSLEAKTREEVEETKDTHYTFTGVMWYAAKRRQNDAATIFINTRMLFLSKIS